LIAERNSEIDALRRALARREDELAQFAAEIDHARTLDEQLEATNERARTAETERAAAVDDAVMVRKIAFEQFAAAEERMKVANARSNLDRARADAAEAAMKVDRARADAAEAAVKAAKEAFTSEVASMRSIISAVQASTSWRMTAPLRSAKRLLIRLHCTNVSYFLAQLWRAMRSWSRAPLRDWRDARIVAGSSYFDGRWYLANNPDVAEAGVDPALHYATRGWREGRNPGPAFDTRDYLAHNHDVERAGVNPLTHYMRHGETDTGARRVVQPAARDSPVERARLAERARDP
jgi:hypothetical protein